jgi:opacity protein-like surface antigen
MRRFVLAVPIVFALAALIQADEALAQGTTEAPAQGTTGIGWKGWGVRVGASADPDQIYGGVHFNLGEFAKDVRFRPTIELGFGDDVTTLEALAEVHYVFSKVQVWKPYVGGGIGLAYVNVDDNDNGNGNGNGDDSDTEFAFAIMGGAETKLKSGNGFFIEGKIGLGDNDPDFKVGVGWSF